MSSLFEKHETHLPNIEAENLSNEDCRFLLRELEKRAFEFVVHSLRAQGPLSQYKEIILDHLKSLFFISDEDFCLCLRLSANNPLLSKIAQEMNPSYDNASEWLAASYSLVDLEFPKILQLNTSPNKDVSKCTQQMIDQMKTYNSLLANEKNALKQLLQVHRQAYVPEKLRRLLQDSEKDIHGRMDLMREKKGPPTSNKVPGRHVGRPRKSELPQYASLKEEMEDSKKIKKVIKLMEDLKSKTKKSQSESGLNQSDFLQENVEQLKNPTEEVLKLQSEFSIHYTGGANVVVIDPEDSVVGKEPKVRKRKSKQDDVTCVCARVVPFIFECTPGQIKPPRGNPDKRTTKRSSTHGFSSSDLLRGAYMGGSSIPSHHSNTLNVSSMSNYYQKKRVPSSPYINGPVNSNQDQTAAKKNSATSVVEDKGKIQQEKITSRFSHVRAVTPETSLRVATSTTLLANPSSIASLCLSNSLNSTTAAPLHYPIQKLFRPSMLHHSANNSVNSKINGRKMPSFKVTSTLVQPLRELKTVSETAGKIIEQQQSGYSVLPQASICQPQLEASGLDVLASVSLLDTIGQQAGPIIDSNTVDTSNATLLPSTSNYVAAQTGSVQKLILPFNALESSGQQQVASISKTATPSLSPVNETGHNFLKKHALEHNGEIDEATTLGSILADPALRNKLFLSAETSRLKTTLRQSEKQSIAEQSARQQ